MANGMPDIYTGHFTDFLGTSINTGADEDFDLSGRRAYRVETLDGEGVIVDAPVEEADLIGSKVSNAVMGYEAMHKPVIDVDVPVRLVPSSREGHSHLYIDTELTASQYGELLDVLVKVGLVERGVQAGYETRGATYVRPPWVKKRECVEDV